MTQLRETKQCCRSIGRPNRQSRRKQPLMHQRRRVNRFHTDLVLVNSEEWQRLTNQKVPRPISPTWSSGRLTEHHAIRCQLSKSLASESIALTVKGDRNCSGSNKVAMVLRTFLFVGFLLTSGGLT